MPHHMKLRSHDARSSNAAPRIASGRNTGTTINNAMTRPRRRVRTGSARSRELQISSGITSGRSGSTMTPAALSMTQMGRSAWKRKGTRRFQYTRNHASSAESVEPANRNGSNPNQIGADEDSDIEIVSVSFGHKVGQTSHQLKRPSQDRNNLLASSDKHASSSATVEEVEIVSVHDHNNPNIVLAHMRRQCGIYEYDGSIRAAMQSCRNCYCFPCDVPAWSCPTWSRHCRASETSDRWRKEREKSKRRKSECASRVVQIE